MAEDPVTPLAGVRVVEVATGNSLVGAGLAGSLPGALLRDHGADVTRVQPAERCTLDDGIEWARVWDRGKQIVEFGDEGCGPVVAELARDADVVFLVGSEELVERQGLGYRDLAQLNQRLIVTRIRPSYSAWGPIPDLELLVHARAGLLTQFFGHRPGPVFCDLSVASGGAALSATVGALACLYEREATGVGGWVETSLYDGMLAILPMVINRMEYPAYVLANDRGASAAMALSYRCADGEYVQLWFGAKGAYEAFLAHIGDPPTAAGYQADIVSGEIGERSRRWAERFATRDRDWWMEHLAGHNFRCEPVLRPGEALHDPHVREIGLAVDHDDPERGTITVLGPVGRVTRVPGSIAPRGIRTDAAPTPRLLSGVRVLDFSAYLAGPVTSQILSELGAEVVKVEPTTGDAHRAVDAMFAAAQRGKRAVAIDLKAPDAAKVLHRLYQWADVVHHNSRIGLPERLGYDERTVRSVNPNLVYSHAAGFGAHGPRARLPANDSLVQALSGVEAANGGDGQGPSYMGWGSLDVTSGWVAACAVLAGLYAARHTGTAQSVTSSLLGAALTMKSGAFVAGDTIVEGPIVDAAQTGYGAAYRIYRAEDGAWLALAAPDRSRWARLRALVGVDGLPAEPPPLRTRRGERQPAEQLLEEVFATKDAATWVAELRAAGVPVELVAELDRDEFNARIVDDPVNHQLGRVVAYDWGSRGRLEQGAFPVRLGPDPRPVAPAHLPALGEHTDGVLAELGFEEEVRDALADAGIIRRGAPEGRPAPPAAVPG